MSTIASRMAQRVLHRLAATCGSEDPTRRTKIEVVRLRRQLSDVDLTVREPRRGLLEAELKATPPTTRTVFIDEIQRVPVRLDAVQAIVDARPRRFRFRSADQARASRGAAMRTCCRGGLCCIICIRCSGANCNLDRVLARGTLPGIYADRDSESRSSTLRSYVDAYLRGEIQAETLVRDVGGYSLLDLAAASSGRVVNLQRYRATPT